MLVFSRLITQRHRLLLCIPWVLLWPQQAYAHSFGPRFSLPLPFWMYGFGAAGALIVSCLVLLVWSAPVRSSNPYLQFAGAYTPESWVKPTVINHAVGLFSVGLLGLTLATAVWGVAASHNNFSMTFVWVICWVGVPYLNALCGYFYPYINPWRWLVERTPLARGLLMVPHTWQHWPACAGMMMWLVAELFFIPSPRTLGHLLMTYTAYTLLGAALMGSAYWFRQADPLSLMCRMYSWLSPTNWLGGSSRLTAPDRPRLDASGILFIMIMLAGTTFDALRESVVWNNWMWQLVLPMSPYAVSNPLQAMADMTGTYRAVELLVWLVSPLLYGLVLTLVAYASVALIARSQGPRLDRFSPARMLVRDVASDMGIALLPIVLGYHIAHYLTLLLNQGTQIVHLLSDPFGFGWNLLGTAYRLRAPWLVDTQTVWNLQLISIMVGHLASLYIAHQQARSYCASRFQLLLSQLPMLFWMVGLTTAGLWTLSQPLKGG